MSARSVDRLGIGIALAAAVLAACLAGRASLAQQEAPDATALDDAMRTFAAISGGWWLNSQCDHLEQQPRQEFEWHIAVINSRLQALSDPQRIRGIIAATRAKAKTLTCGEQSDRFVLEALDEARALNRRLNGLEFDAEQSTLGLWVLRYHGYAQAAGIAERCRFGSDDARADFLTLVDAIGAKLSQESGKPEVMLKGKRLKAAAGGEEGPACNEQAKAAVDLALSGARALGVDLGLWSSESGLVE